MLMKLTMEKTLIDAEVSFRMLILRCVRWYSNVSDYNKDESEPREHDGDLPPRSYRGNRHPSW